MKKIILIIICLFAFPNIVNAEVYYGEYKKVDNIEGMEEDLYKIEKYKVYNTYKKEYENLGYMEENKDYIIDYEDYIEEERVVNYYKESDVYINIKVGKEKNFYFSLHNIPFNAKLYELEIYNNDELLNYDIYSGSVFGETLQYLYDNDYNTYFYYRHSNFVSPLLINPYILENLKIIIYTDVDSNYNINFNINGNFTPIILNNEIKRKHIITFDYIEDFDKNKNYEAEYTYIDKIKLYKHYKENIIITNNYIKEGKNIILEDYKEIEEYYYRDKLELENNIEIKNKDEKIEDYILYSTNKPIINCNINYNDNGIYICNFILNDIDITKEVIVNIPKDTINVPELKLDNKNENTKEDLIFEDKNDYILNEDIILEENNKEEISTITIETKNELNLNENNTLEETKEIEIKNNNEKIISNKKEVDIEKVNNLSNKQNNKGNITIKENVEVDVKKYNKDNNLNTKLKKSTNKKLNIIKYIIFINLLALEIILYIRKNKRNNVE